MGADINDIPEKDHQFNEIAMLRITPGQKAYTAALATSFRWLFQIFRGLNPTPITIASSTLRVRAVSALSTGQTLVISNGITLDSSYCSESTNIGRNSGLELL